MYSLYHCESLSWQELACNVKTLILHACTVNQSNSVYEYDENNPNKSHLIMCKKVRHRFTIDENDCWCEGQVVSQVSPTLIFKNLL